MRSFMLHFIDGTIRFVQGKDLAHACWNAGMHLNQLAKMDYFDELVRTTVMGQAQCGCVHHAEEQENCPHDFQLVGLV